MSKCIAVIEDDENLRNSLVDYLELEGYQVFSFELLEQAQCWLSANQVDLILLDIMLPDGNGYQFSRWLEQNSNALVLMLTARSMEQDIIEGFVSGADDYVTKPYRISELLLRIKALLKRQQPKQAAQDTTVINGFDVNWQLREVNHQGSALHLTKTAFDILQHLYSQCNQVCSREQILDKVWGENVYVDNRTIDNFISVLKKQLNLQPGQHYYIKTVRGVGYSMIR